MTDPFVTIVLTLWIAVLAAGLLITDISIQRHGWRSLPLFFIRACAVPAGIIFLAVCMGWGQVADTLNHDNWLVLTRIVNTPARQTAAYGSVIAVASGAVYLITTITHLIYRGIRYIAAGPPWLPSHRELDRQIREEFHGGSIQMKRVAFAFIVVATICACSPTTEVINYRTYTDPQRGIFYIVDGQVLDKAMLLSGTGTDQIRVDITRQGK